MNNPTLLEQHLLGIFTLTLNRIAVRNALNDALIQEITQHLQRLTEDVTCRVLILRGAGPHFCAGADIQQLKDAANYTLADNLASSQRLAEMFAKLAQFPHPTIAVVQGAASGGGAGLVACCDIVLATPDARFAFPEVRLGVTPAVISPYVLRAIGPRATQRYFLTGESFNAEQAQQLQLVHQVVLASELEATLDTLCMQLKQNSPHAMTITKKLIHDVSFAPLNESLVLDTARCIAEIRVSDEGQEGLRAFLEKRSPEW